MIIQMHEKLIVNVPFKALTGSHPVYFYRGTSSVFYPSNHFGSIRLNCDPKIFKPPKIKYYEWKKVKTLFCISKKKVKSK